MIRVGAGHDEHRLAVGLDDAPRGAVFDAVGVLRDEAELERAIGVGVVVALVRVDARGAGGEHQPGAGCAAHWCWSCAPPAFLNASDLCPANSWQY